MDKKYYYIGLGIVIAALLVVGGIYWQSRKVAISPIEPEVSFEEQSLEQDLTELEEFEEDKSLENLEQDLSDVAKEEILTEKVPTPGKKIDITSIENLESELNSELASFTNDLGDLESGFVNDTSLDDLDSGLSGVVK